MIDGVTKCVRRSNGVSCVAIENAEGMELEQQYRGTRKTRLMDNIMAYKKMTKYMDNIIIRILLLFKR